MTPTSDQDPLLMTLAGIAYGAPEDIARYLYEASLTTGAWRLDWLAAPPTPPVNFAYLARNDLSGDCVIAIRGTYPNPFSPAYWDDGQQDSPFGTMADWPGAPGARIGAGTAQGLAGLLALVDAGGSSLLSALRASPPKGSLTVTGHSLGGTLAPVLALHLAGALPALDIRSVSFAGMTPGNAAFAALFGTGTRFEGKARRVYNTLDTVAYGWDRVWATHDFYEPAPKGGTVVAAALLATAARLEVGGYGYTAIGTEVPLQGVLRPMRLGSEIVAYIFENLYQHLPDTYLCLLGAPPLPFALLFGNVLVPRAHPAASALPGPGQPVVYLR